MYVMIKMIFLVRHLGRSHVAETQRYLFTSGTPGLAHNTMVLCCRGGDNFPSATKISHSTNKICGTLACGFVSLENGAYPPPATSNYGFASQTKLWTQIYNLNWVSTHALRQKPRIEQT